jgi:hypothetical protein
MNPIYIVLYAVVVTLLLTIAFPRIRQAAPSDRRRMWLLFIGGVVALLVVTVLVLNR